MAYQRLLNINPASEQSFFLFGPRGTGKTFWVKVHFPHALYIDLLDTEIYFDLLAKPSLLASMIAPHFKQWIIIDEVQKIPSLLNEIHRLIAHEGYKFILTGSSARSLKRKGVNLLAGRALTYTMHPLICTELAEDFSLATATKYGTLPFISASEDPQHYLESYITTYLREEILQEGITRNLGEFARFLETASFSQGCILNMSEIAREAAIERKIVVSYFSILEDLLIAFQLPSFTKRAKRRMVQHPKFYFFDAGVFRTLRPMGILDSPEEADGPALETLFIQHLRAINDYLHLGYGLYYWQTSNHVEVDFIAYGARGFYAFEIKRKKKLAAKDFSGLKAFHKEYPMAKLFLLYGGDRKEYHDNIAVFPLVDALWQLADILSSPSA